MWPIIRYFPSIFLEGRRRQSRDSAARPGFWKETQCRDFADIKPNTT